MALFGNKKPNEMAATVTLGVPGSYVQKKTVHVSRDRKLTFYSDYDKIYRNNVSFSYDPAGLDFDSGKVYASHSVEYFLSEGQTGSRTIVLFCTKEAMLWKMNVASIEDAYVFDDGRSIMIYEADNGGIGFMSVAPNGETIKKVTLPQMPGKIEFHHYQAFAMDSEYLLSIDVKTGDAWIVKYEKIKALENANDTTAVALNDSGFMLVGDDASIVRLNSEGKVVNV